jgi:hypothetical protein
MLQLLLTGAASICIGRCCVSELIQHLLLLLPLLLHLCWDLGSSHMPQVVAGDG